MNAWPFVTAAYGLVLVASLAMTVWSWRSMVMAERRAAEVTRR